MRSIAGLGLRRPLLVLIATAVVVVLAGVTVPGLGVSTSRTALVSEDDPDQARLNRFLERFGYPDTPVILVGGPDAEARHQTVDALETALEAKPEFAGRVVGRLSPQDVANVLFLFKPDALLQARQRMGDDLPRLLEGGVVAWVGALKNQLAEGLAEDSEAPTVEVDVDQALGQLAQLPPVFIDVLEGRDPLQRMGGSIPTAATEAAAGLSDGGYVVVGDGAYDLVVLYADMPGDEGTMVKPIVDDIRATRDDVLAQAPEGITADVSGLPAVIVDELALVQRGLLESSIAATAGIMILCFLLFRSVRHTIIALIPLLPGVVVTLAAVRLVYGELNLITSSFVAVLLGLGIDFSVHVLTRYNEQAREGVDRAVSVRGALVGAGPGIVTGTVITAGAFLTTATTDFTAYAELGIITSIGLLVIMLATFFLIPALLARQSTAGAAVAPHPPGLRRVPGLIRRLRWPFLILGFAGAVAGAVALPRIDFNPRYFDFLPKRTESARALVQLEYDPVASPVFANLEADGIEKAREMTTTLRELDSVAGVQSPSDLLPPLSEADHDALRQAFDGLGADPDFAKLGAQPLPPADLQAAVDDLIDTLDEIRFALSGAGRPTKGVVEAIDSFRKLRDAIEGADADAKARLADLHPRLAALLAPAWSTAKAVATRGGYAPQDLPPMFADRYVSKDGEAVALFVVPSGSFWDADVATRFRADVKAIDPEASGLAFNHVRHGEMIVRGLQRAAGIAAVLILLVLIADFRSIRDALLALLPTALGWLWMLGVMGAVGLRFNVANVVSLPLVLGIGIAFGVHLMHRVNESERERKGPASMQDVVHGTGGAVMIAALTTMVGFAGLMLGEYGGMKSLGLLMVIGIGSCLLASVFVLPAALVTLGRVEID